MAEFSRVMLSGSTQGRPIKISQTASAGNTIHTTGTSASIIDEVTMFGANTDANDPVDVHVQFGGTTSPDDERIVTLPPLSGAVLLVAGDPLTGTGAAGNVVRVYASAANVVTVTGWISRYTP